MGSDRNVDNTLRSSVGIVIGIFLTCWLASLVDPLIIAFTIWIPALIYVFVRLPVHQVAQILVLIGLVLEGPEDRPGNGYWEPPFIPISRILFAGLNKSLSIPGASFSLFTVLCVVLLVRARKACKARSFLPTPESRSAINLYLIGIVCSCLWGLGRGGSGQPMFWQLIYPVTTAIAMAAMLWSLRGKQDLHALGTILVVVALTKAMLVAWVYFVVCAPQNIKPFYATTHSDSVNFAAAFTVLVVRAFEERSKTAIRAVMWIAPLLLIAVYMNNRRLAFVSMAASVLVAIIFMKPGKAKRRILTGAIAVSPLIVAYFAVGQASSHPFFALAKAFSSVSSSSDSSSATRDIENYNLYVTLKQSLLGGTGFGNEYVEAVVADDISGSHPLYRYIPHNSVLWIVSVGGILFFHLLWLPNAALAFFAYRAYRVATVAIERAGALAAACILFIYMFQAWGDMGISSYTSGLMFAVAYAIAARLDQTVGDGGERRRRVSVSPVR
jgi:hypothetical protein